MRIEWKSLEDRARVWNGYRRAFERRQTAQRDRYNVVLLLGDAGPDGQALEREQIVAAVGRSRQGGSPRRSGRSGESRTRAKYRTQQI